jgi:Acyl-coenzyme A:6-aminopenicillanic acid acyl-transferase
LMHCNQYLRMDIEQVTGMIIDSSVGRMDTFKSFKAPKNRDDVIQMLGDNSAEEHTVFREKDETDYVKTIACGIFDCSKRTLSLYSDNPKCNEPLVVLPLVIKEKK